MTALALALLLAQRPAPPATAARTYAVAAGSELSYRAVHRLHAVEGTSRAVEGRVRLLPDGGAQVMVRARVDGFDSGNGNRDAHVREALEAARHPYVVLKAVGAGARPAAYPATVQLRLAGELELHGRARPIEVPVTVRWETEDRARGEAAFEVSLEAHEVERPSLLFVKVDDRLEIRVRLELEVER